MSSVLNMLASSFRMRRAEANLAAARELAIARTVELETVEPEAAAPGTIEGPETIADGFLTRGGPLIAGGFLTLGFLGFFGGMGSAHKTSGPMIRAFGLRPA